MFDPLSPILFQVLLPNGTILKTIPPDNTFPNPPNNIIQISALFSIELIKN